MKGTPQDTTLYVNGRKIVIKEQGDKIKVKLYERASGGDTITNAPNLRRSLPERTEYGKPHRTERPPLLQKEQQEKQI